MTAGQDLGYAIGRRIRQARLGQGLSRRTLAGAADVSERYLNQLEKGDANASIGVLGRVAQALGSSVAALVSGGDPPPQSGIEPALAARLALLDAAQQQTALALIETHFRVLGPAKRGVALLGLRGAGKSTLGRALAQRCGVPFVSVTREVEAAAGMELAALFDLGGPTVYRRLELEAVNRIAAARAPQVVETAGGIAGHPEALAVVLATFTTVWLRASPQEHLSRVAGQGDLRPMRGNPRAIEHIAALLGEREAGYRRADVMLDTQGRSVDACLEELQDRVGPCLAAGVMPPVAELGG